jgi:hypothetical protein
MGNSNKLIEAIARARIGLQGMLMASRQGSLQQSVIADKHFYEAMRNSCKGITWCFNSSTIAFIKGIGNGDDKLTVDELYSDLSNEENIKQISSYLKKNNEDFKKEDVVKFRNHLGDLQKKGMGLRVIAEVYKIGPFNYQCPNNIKEACPESQKNVRFNDLP